MGGESNRLGLDGVATFVFDRHSDAFTSPVRIMRESKTLCVCV